ncbi:hypothetical protein B6N60_00467 [Richelia sinica FACHB-800]|uniref:Uncharacterized protein n=1 Tax=Richelia sinica FACHB-800 TaxID=1357546 RepID=A0A975T4A0_9NOST|nr:hypothetical protein [Richelia sinica]MBD2662948.1 hypothetical protein [Richelia sinica FACHB-800]QXE21789.1 hypothetical protein B6N60_00467 [Richelia sinica FACHB-800]
MENWQFLIQKQGDRTWNNLESPNLKISEGKYRVLARSHLPNMDVEVRIIHSSIQEVPPKRRVVKRLRRTSAEGLLAVIPFTHLKPGIWEVRCSGDLMADMLGQSWQQNLLIQVLPQEVSDPSELLPNEDSEKSLTESVTSAINPADSSLNTLSAETEEDLIIDQPVSPVWFKGETAEQILQNLIDLALPNSESLEDQSIEDVSPNQDQPLQITLDQDAYIAIWGESLSIHGDVELKAAIDENPANNSLQGLTMEIELRSPWESNILTQEQQTLTDQTLPFSFTATIPIPANCESKLILAEIRLYGRFSPLAQNQLLASSAFTITADVTELLAFKNTNPETLDTLEETQNPPHSLKKAEKTASLGLELFNIAKNSRKLVQFPTTQSATTEPLPPRIKSTDLVDGQSPQLPTLPENPKKSESDESAAPVDKPAIPPIDLGKLAIKSTQGSHQTTSFPYLKRLTSSAEPAETTKPKKPELFTFKTPELPATPPVSELELTSELLPESPTEELEDTATIEPLPGDSLVTSELQVSPEPEPLPSDSLVTSEPQPSPLLKMWMQNQGYSGLEPLDIGQQDNNSEQFTPEETSTVSAETVSDDIALAAASETETPIYTFTDLLPNLETELPVSAQASEEVNSATSEPPPEVSVSHPPLITTLPAWLSEEIVIDDLNDVIYEPQDHSYVAAQVENQPEDIPIPGIQSIPTPQLYVPEGELVAASELKIRVEMPDVPASVAVKLWIEDYQTRALLDGPHLLTDLRPNNWGTLEATAKLLVPLGCLEMRVQAIALDQSTHQESHKVTVVRTVVPPDLQTMELDELLEI